MGPNTNPQPHQQHNPFPFNWNGQGNMRVPSGEFFISGNEGNIIFAMLWDLNMRVANLEFTVYGSNVVSNTVATTAQLETLANTLSTSTASLAALINQNAKSLMNK